MAGVQRYEIIDRVAAGGMAEVYVAHAHGEHGFRKEVAIKRILPHLATSAELEQRFIAEAKVSVSLGHSNIVQVLDFGRDEHSLFIAMEFIRGANLAELLAAARRAQTHLPLPAVMHIMIGIAQGLEFAHARNVLHRDLSPSNVLVSEAGEVKVADFGIAKVLGEETTTNRIAGKWAYMSPEQARGELLDRRSDVFAAGVVLWEMLTGQRLFSRKHWDESRQAVLSAPILTPTDVRTDIPEELSVIAMTALERDPAKRYQTCAELARALSEACIRVRIIHTADDVARAVTSLGAVKETKRAVTAATAAQLDLSHHTLVRKAEGTAAGEITQWASSVATSPPAPRRGVMLALGVLVLAGIAGGVLAFALPGTAEVPASTPVAATAPADAATIAVDAAPAIVVDAAPEATPVDTPPDAPPDPPPDPPPDARARPAVRYGTITVNVAPWAFVYVNGKKKGQTPLRDLELPVGRHKITLVNPDLDAKKTVTVEVPRAKPYAFRLEAGDR